MLLLPKTSRPSKKTIKARRRKQVKEARKTARACKINLNELLSKLHAEWEHEDAINNAYSALQWIFEKILSEELINQIAKATGLQERVRKIHPLPLVSVLMMGSMDVDVASYKIMCNLLQKWFNIIVKPQSLQDYVEREETYAFIKKVQSTIISFEFDRVLSKMKAQKGHLQIKGFNRILLQDSTVISLPKTMWRIFSGCGGAASKAAVKIDVIFNLTGSNIVNMTCMAGRVCDRNASVSGNILSHVKSDDIVIRDLGYFNIKQLEEIVRLGAHFISRLSNTINIYLNKDDKDPVNIIEHIESLGIAKKEIDITVYLGKKERIPFRLIAIKVPQEVVEARRQQHKRARGQSKEPSESLMEWNGYTFMITNIPKEKLSHKAILKIYIIRWQIELLFKNFKSNLNIDEIDGKKKYRILCFIHIKILLAWLVTLIYSYAQTLIDKEVSFYQLTIWLLKVANFKEILATGEISCVLHELPAYIDGLCKQGDSTSWKNIQNQLKEELLEKTDGFLEKIA